MTRRSALILLNGELPNPSRVRAMARGRFLICCDGGSRHAAALGLTPRLIIGDMDSLPRRRVALKRATFLCDFDENASDFEKALRFLSRRGFLEAWVAGAAGGKLDHLLVNLALMEKYSSRMRLHLLGDLEASLLHKGRHTFNCGRGQRVSLLPAGKTAVVTAAGLRYPLKRFPLERGSRGLGNQAVSNRVRIRLHSGRLWFLR